VSEPNRKFALSTFGRYTLLEKIGAGGMAEIYRAKAFGAAGFEKEFAIKMILPSLVDDKEFVSMFINEAKIAVSLYHGNVVQVFDLGELDSQYYIAMEFIHGKDLLDVMASCVHRDMKIGLDLVIFITMEFLKGLDFAHRAKNSSGEDLNIIHRDVSPSNILISYSGDVKIGDFGVAKATIERTLTEAGTLKGKVEYMSPEQVVGDEIDHRSDVFSAGIVFFEALSLSRLFVGKSDLDVMIRIRDADIEANLKKTGPFPKALEEIIRKSLSRQREERYQTAGEFYQALQEFCYSQRIKVSGNDLSDFMKRLFAERIEEEEMRRKSEEWDGANEPTIPQMEELRFAPYATYEGQFISTSFSRIFARLHRKRATGRLHLTHNEIEKTIYFEVGEPILVESNQVNERLGLFLLSRKVISKSQLKEGLDRLTERGGRLGDALVAIRAIPAHEVFKYLSEQMREKILDIFTWKGGRWEYYENQQPDTHGYPLGVDAYGTVSEGCLERIPIALIREFYLHKMNIPVMARQSSPANLDKLRLPTKAMRVINQLESGDHLNGLCAKLPGSQQELAMRVVYLLHQVEHLTLENTEKHDLPE